MKKLIIAGLAAFTTLGTSVSMADNWHYDYYWDYKWWEKDTQAYYDCAWSPKQYFDGTITDAVVANATADVADPEFEVLLAAVLAAGLEGALAGDGYFTVYAPTDAAFGAVPGALLQLLLDNPDTLLTDVLLYHVIGQKSHRTDPRRVWDPSSVETLNGQSVFLNRSDDNPRVNNSVVSCTPVMTWNGIIYIIDSVLLPQFLQPEPEPDPKSAH